MNRLGVVFAHSLHAIFDIQFARIGRSHETHHDVGGRVLRERRAGHGEDRRPVRGDRAGERGRRAAAVVDRQRGLELVAGRDKARGVGHRDELRRDLALDGRGTGGGRAVRDGRHAHLAHELRQLERRAGLAVHHGNASAPQRERLESARGHGAHAAQHLRAESAAGLHAVHAQLVLAHHRQNPVIEVVERMLGAAQLRDIPDGIGRLAAAEDVDRLVHDRHHGDRRARRGHLHVDFAEADHLGVHLHGNLVLLGADRDRGLSVRAGSEVARVGRHALHHGHVHVEVRRFVRLHGTQLHLARRVREVQHLRIDLLLAHDRDERVPRERRLDGEARHFARAVVRLVRNDRHLGRIRERRTHHVVAPVAEVEVHAERRVRLRVLDREHVVAGTFKRQFEDRVLVRGGGDDDVGRHEHVYAVAVPRLPAIGLLAVRVHSVDALDLRDELARFGKARAVRCNARHGHRRTPPLLEFHAARRRRSDVERIVVLDGALPRGGGTSAVLKHHALRRCAHRSLGEPRIGPDRRLIAEGAVGRETLPLQFPVVGLEAAALVSETPALPVLGGERHVLEHDRALAGKPLRRPAEEMFGLDGEREVGGMRSGCRIDGHANLRRGELFDLHVHVAQMPSVLAGNLRDDGPPAARLVVRDGEPVVGDRALAVRCLRDGGVGVAVGIDEAELHRHRRRCAPCARADDDVRENLLAVAVNAAVGPAEGRRFLVVQVFLPPAVGV